MNQSVRTSYLGSVEFQWNVYPFIHHPPQGGNWLGLRAKIILVLILYKSICQNIRFFLNYQPTYGNNSIQNTGYLWGKVVDVNEKYFPLFWYHHHQLNTTIM